MDNTIDPRLVALYNEYLEAGKEYEFINMIYALLDTVTMSVRQKVYRARAAWKRKISAPLRKEQKEKIEQFFEGMSTEELIKFQNTPWNELPEWIREAMPKLVQYPMENNYVRIYGLVNKDQRQQEITASRLTRYMEKHGFITSDEEGTHLHYDHFAEVCNEFAEKYDLPWRPGRKSQKVRITKRDLKNYTQCRVTPKGDKMAVLSSVTELPLWYLGGYLNDNVPDIMPTNPLTPAPLTTGKFKKTRKQTSGDNAG